MIIQCTKKLLDQLKKKPEMVEEEDPLISWHANFLTLNRRKTVVLVNDKNRYTIVLHGLKAKDFKNMDKIILQSIRNTFEHECIRNDVIKQFIHSSNTIAYTKTKNKKLVARMNKACETLYFFGRMLDPNTIYQPDLSLEISRDLVGDGKNDYFHPNEEMYKDLEKFTAFTGTSILQTKAIEMMITLRLENFKVYRKLIVPMHFTFHQLHKAIQTAFGWQNSHLHEFYIFDSKKSNQPFLPNHPAYDGERYKPIINLVCNEEAFSYGDDAIPMKMDDTIKLSEYMPAKATYIYDFGDDWIHDIEVERVMEDYDRNTPICLEGEGNTPPEDVGGEIGYENFLEIMADENHPDHKHMRSWSSGQLHQNFDIEMVNRMLKYM
ncbi:plasmid pRiA4b ORF-3 family protein [Gracilibacillus sp. YIM 98692]|uniref:plasmid pRiA4b ORF-3 family protein n=1 Tax=Gracilibacillus sp. YIM 98692 TaxID=2663532 RepID=UPI0013D85F98|nr:plasmid pRiA4b ORF-3 family protein [Gracilibacillus sp. YIM 98692]